MNKIPKEYEIHSVEHHFGGNGWAVVQVLEGEMCRVSNFFQDKEGRWKVGNQMFLVWQKMLKLEPERKLDSNKNWVNTGNFLRIPSDVVDAIGGIRDSISSGEYIVKNTRLVKAE